MRMHGIMISPKSASYDIHSAKSLTMFMPSELHNSWPNLVPAGATGRFKPRPGRLATCQWLALSIALTVVRKHGGRGEQRVTMVTVTAVTPIASQKVRVEAAAAAASGPGPAPRRAWLRWLLGVVLEHTQRRSRRPWLQATVTVTVRSC